MSYDQYAELERAADKLGRERGHAAGTWVIDGNTSADDARAIIAGYEDSDPEVMDMQPSPLSGEWADDPTIADVLGDIASEADDDIDLSEDNEWADDLLTAFESAYSDGFWREVIRSATAVLPAKVGDDE